MNKTWTVIGQSLDLAVQSLDLVSNQPSSKSTNGYLHIEFTYDAQALLDTDILDIFGQDVDQHYTGQVCRTKPEMSLVFYCHLQ